MLAVRAFLHFDMLRLFGPVYKLHPEAVSIPYNESSKVAALPLMTADSVLHEKILRDLDEAEKLLADSDPVIENGRWPLSGKTRKFTCAIASCG